MEEFQLFIANIKAIHFYQSRVDIQNKDGRWFRYSPDKFWGEIYPKCISKLHQAQEAAAGTLEQAS